MATTVTAATFTSKITEAITLNGVDHGGTQTLTIASATEVSRRIVEVGTTEIVLVAFQATNPGAGTFDEADVRYVRISNLDDTNHVQLTFRDDDSTEFATKLDAGHSFIYSGDNSGGVVSTMIAAGSALTVPSTFADLVDITAVANTAACDLEYMVVGV
jgi:hypothetical protein